MDDFTYGQAALILIAMFGSYLIGKIENNKRGKR